MYRKMVTAYEAVTMQFQVALAILLASLVLTIVLLVTAIAIIRYLVKSGNKES